MSVFVNDRAITDLVWNILAADGHLSPVVPLSPTVPMANAPGILGTAVTVSARRIVVTLDLRPATLVARDTALDAIARRMSGLIELRFDSAPTRALTVTCVGVDVQLYTGAHANPGCIVVVSFEASDPTRRTLEPTIATLSTTRRACPIGAQPSAPLLWLYGNATAVVNPVVIVADFRGVEVSRLTLTGVTAARAAASLTTNNALAIDCATQTIDYYVAGVKQTGTEAGLSWYASGVFPILAPEDAAPDLSAWPTVALASTAGAATGLLVYYTGN